MKIIFAGTPDFAVPTLEKLIASEHEIVAVYMQPDRPAGRGRKLTASPVKQLAEQHALAVYQPKTLKDAKAQKQLQKFGADVMIVVAYGLILPQAVIDMFEYGCVNIHPSLLPRWRGAAPIQRTILSGDMKTGVATMLIDAGMDSGPILLLEQVEVKPRETSGQLHDRCAVIGADLLLKTLEGLASGVVVPQPQSEDGLTLAAKVTKAEAKIDWTKSANQLQNEVCGYHPSPISHGVYRGDVIRILEAYALDQSTDRPSGTLLAATKEGVDVATGEGVLRLVRVQLPGGKPLSACEFINREQKHLIAGGQLFG